MNRYSLYYSAEASQRINVDAETLEQAEELASEQLGMLSRVGNDFDIGDSDLHLGLSTCNGEPIGPPQPASDDDTELEALRRFAAEMRRLVAGEYTTWDRDEKLGEPPYDKDALAAWEEAHGHDVRLKCFPEFGCQLLIDPEDMITDLLAALDASTDTHPPTEPLATPIEPIDLLPGERVRQTIHDNGDVIVRTLTVESVDASSVWSTSGNRYMQDEGPWYLLTHPTSSNQQHPDRSDRP